VHPFLSRFVILPLHEALLRRPTLSYLRQLEESQWWSLDQLHELQRAKLKRLLVHAYAHAPFYRRRIDDAGIDPAAVTLDDLAHLPTLDKRQIMEHTADIVAPRVPGGLHAATTGGSTGEPLAFLTDRRRQAADQAARARSRRWFGIEPGQREVYLWGSPIERRRRDRLRAWRDRLANHLLLDAFDMTPRSMCRHLDEIRRFDPVHVFGYPSSVAALFRHARQLGRNVQNPSLRAVFVTGELFPSADRAIIEEMVSVPVADGYGSREGGFIAHQCPSGSYHVTMESVIVELLDSAGRPIADHQVGEIVITHLDARGMPFIRYRTGDMARWSDERCPCGRGLAALRGIEGRRTDMLRRPGGGYAHALAVIYVLRDEPLIAQFKVVQRANLDLDVALVPRGPLNGERLEHLGRALRARMGGNIAVRCHLVDVIPPDPSGKHRYVVSEAR